MTAAIAFKNLIGFFYWLSPYRWLDTWLKSQQDRVPSDSQHAGSLLRLRYAASEAYIFGWFLLVVAIFFLCDQVPIWGVGLLLGRVFGILNKELGVVIFGTCKVTPGRQVSDYERVVTLALLNFATALMAFSSVYASVGSFDEIEACLIGPHYWALLHSASNQITLSGVFTAADQTTQLITLFQNIFCFFFTTIIISMFVSLLRIESKDSET